MCTSFRTVAAAALLAPALLRAGVDATRDSAADGKHLTRTIDAWWTTW